LQVLCGQLLVPDDIYIVDPELHSRLSKFSSIAAAHAEAADMSEVCDPSSLLFSGCPVDELGLTMTVPGYDDLEMVPGGSDIGVTTFALLSLSFTCHLHIVHPKLFVGVQQPRKCAAPTARRLLPPSKYLKFVQPAAAIRRSKRAFFYLSQPRAAAASSAAATAGAVCSVGGKATTSTYTCI
jgi:hypothetical protein